VLFVVLFFVRWRSRASSVWLLSAHNRNNKIIISVNSLSTTTKWGRHQEVDQDGLVQEEVLEAEEI